ncbi:hypothetical protein [Streptomyces sp. Caat 7-52]|uniref:hypothetical protein n=1 Tax=Streptomyces sp. Caat 7-52 TaxID=2949637 RepID=UPI003336D115
MASARLSAGAALHPRYRLRLAVNESARLAPYPREAEAIARSLPKRKREYASVRMCARRAMNARSAPGPTLGLMRRATACVMGSAGAPVRVKHDTVAPAAAGADLVPPWREPVDRRGRGRSAAVGGRGRPVAVSRRDRAPGSGGRSGLRSRDGAGLLATRHEGACEGRALTGGHRTTGTIR